MEQERRTDRANRATMGSTGSSSAESTPFDPPQSSLARRLPAPGKVVAHHAVARVRHVHQDDRSGGSAVDARAIDLSDRRVAADAGKDRGGLAPAPAVTPALAETELVLAEVVGVERVPVDGHFFDDLGLDSMVMARFCARLRKRSDLPAVWMKDVYRHPTTRSLAAALATPAPASTLPVPTSALEPTSVVTSAAEVPRPTRRLSYVSCGVLQALCFVAYSYLAALVLVRGFTWISAGAGLVDIYVRSVLVGGASFLAACIVPIVAKWMLIGRWKPRQIPVWGPCTCGSGSSER